MILQSAIVAESSCRQYIDEYMILCSNKNLCINTKIRISYNFHTHEILLFFDLFQLLKNAKPTHCLWAEEKQVVGQKALICQYLTGRILFSHLLIATLF